MELQQISPITSHNILVHIMQVSSGMDPEMSTQDFIWSVAQTSRGGAARSGPPEGEQDLRGRHAQGPDQGAGHHQRIRQEGGKAGREQGSRDPRGLRVTVPRRFP